jgi:hypothetical protein
LSKAQTFSPHPLKKHLNTKKLKFCQKLKTPHPPQPFLSSKPIEATQPKRNPQFFSKAQNSSPQPKIEPKNFTFKIHYNKKIPIHISHTHTHLSLSLSRSLILSKHWDPFDIIITITAAGRVPAFKGVRKPRDFEDSSKSTKWYLKGPPAAPSPHKTQQRWRTGTAMSHYISKIENTSGFVCLAPPPRTHPPTHFNKS